MRVGQVSRFSVDETCYTIKFGKTDQSLLTSFAIFKNSSCFRIGLVIHFSSASCPHLGF